MVKIARKLLSLSLALMMITACFAFNVSAEADKYFYSNEKSVVAASLTTTTNIEVPIYISNIDYLKGFQFTLTYDNTIFKAVSVLWPTYGILDVKAGNTYGTTGASNIVDIAATNTYAYDPDDDLTWWNQVDCIPQEAPYLICTVRFRVKAANPPGGVYPISLSNVKLIGQTEEIPAGASQMSSITLTPVPNDDPVDPIVTWPTVSPITYGQTFADAISGGSAIAPVTSAAVPGTFAIADAATVPNAGTHTGKTITFTPADTGAFNVKTTTVDVTVNKADQAAPSLTASTTKNSVTIDTVANAVYGLKLKSDATAVSYGASNVFSGLRPSTEYTAFIKLPATTNFNESAVVSADFTTAAKPAPVDRTFDKINLSKPGTIDIKGPSDVAVDSTGSIIVADSMNSRVLKYDQTGALLATYGELGAGVGQFNTPVGLVVGADDSIYVADTYNSRIVKFKDTNTNGVIDADEWTAWGTYGNGVKEFKKPAGLFVAGTKVYVADTYNHRIAIFDTVDGGFWAAYGSKGTGDSNFFYPMDVAVDAYGDIWVADVYNNAVKQLNAAGEFVSSYAAALPYGVAIDADGNVYASLRTAGKIICVNSPKEYGGKGVLANQFINPTGITFDSEGNLWVVDVSTNTVKKALGI